MKDWMYDFIYGNPYKSIGQFWDQLAQAASGMPAREFSQNFLEPSTIASTLDRIVKESGLKSGPIAINLQTLGLVKKVKRSSFREGRRINYAKLAETIEGLDEKQVLVIKNYGKEKEPVVFDFNGNQFMKKYPTLEVRLEEGEFLDDKIVAEINSVRANDIRSGFDWKSKQKIQVVQLVDVLRSYLLWHGIHPEAEISTYSGSSESKSIQRVVVQGIQSLGKNEPKHFVAFSGVPVYNTTEGKISLRQDGTQFAIDYTSFDKSLWENVKFSRYTKKGKRHDEESSWGYANILATLMLQEYFNKKSENILLPFPQLNSMDTIRYFWKTLNNVLIETEIETNNPNKKEYKLKRPTLNQIEALIWARVGYRNSLKSSSAKK